MPTTRTSLRTVASINELNDNAFICRFVGKKALQLGETPIAHRTALFASSFDPFSNISQVLHADGIARVERANNLLCGDMVRVFLKPLQAARQFLQMSFRALRAFSLKRTAQAEVAVIGFFEMFTAKETRLRGNGKAIDTQINTDPLVLSSGSNRRLLTRYDHMQPEGPVTIEQIRTFLVPLWRQVLLVIRGNLDRNHRTITNLSCLLHMHERNHT